MSRKKRGLAETLPNDCKSEKDDVLRADEILVSEVCAELEFLKEENKLILQNFHRLQQKTQYYYEQSQKDRRIISDLEATIKDKNRKLKSLSEKKKNVEKQKQLLEETVLGSAKELREVKDENESFRRGLAWRVLAPARAISKPFRAKSRDQVNHDKEIKIIKQSGLFDTAWYLHEYPDVADSGLDPIEHFVKHGAAEGRNPSAEFCTDWYRKIYFAVLETGINPLVHFIQFGKDVTKSTKVK